MAQAVVGALRVNLGLDSAQFSRGLQNADSNVKKFEKAAKRAAIAVGAAFTAAAGAMSIAVKRTIDSADRLGYVASMLGVNVRALQELRYAAERNNIGIQNFDVALRRFIRRASEAAQGTGAAKDAFSELGVSLTDSHGRLKDSEVLLGEVADALQKVRDPADKLRIAFKMFDTDGAAMVNMLNEGSAGIEKLRKEARVLGIVLSEEAVQSAQNFNNNLDLLRKSAAGFAARVTEAVLPALEIFTAWLVRAFQDTGPLIRNLRRVGETAAVAGAMLAAAFSPALLGMINSIAVAIGVRLLGALRAVTALLMANPLTALAGAIAVAITAIWHFRDEISKAIGVDVAGIFYRAGNLIINSFQAAYEHIKFGIVVVRDWVGSTMVQITNIVIRQINNMVAGALAAINGMIRLANRIPKVNIAEVGGFAEIPEIADTYGARLVGVLERHNKRIRDIMSRDAIGQLGDYFKRLRESMSRPSETPAQEFEDLAEAADQFGDVVSNVETKFDANKFAFQNWMRSVSDGFADAILKAKSFGDVLKGLLHQLARAELSNWLFNTLVPAGGGGSILAGLFGGFRADGGPVTAGRPYIVGERGPELIVPRTSGQVIPNHELGGSQVIVNQTIAPNFAGNAATRQEVLEIAAMTQQATLAALPNHIKRGGSYAQAVRGR